MNARSRRLCVALVASLLSVPALAWAQNPETVTQFVGSSDLDAMKYRHLWLAYGVIWLLIMAFVARTARRQSELKKDLDLLSSRVDDMEKNRE
jgi:CcmD family protein